MQFKVLHNVFILAGFLTLHKNFPGLLQRHPKNKRVYAYKNIDTNYLKIG